MRHRKRTRVFERSYRERSALLNSLARAVIINERIKTTCQKAKEAVKVVDRLISLGKKNDLHSRRLAYKILKDRGLIKILFDEIAPRFKNRNGGYSRILLSDFRKGDGAQMAILELVQRREKKPKEPAKKKEAKKRLEKKEEKTPEQAVEAVRKKEKETKVEEKHEAAPPIKKHLEPKKEPKKKFFGGLRKFFKKERDSL